MENNFLSNNPNIADKESSESNLNTAKLFSNISECAFAGKDSFVSKYLNVDDSCLNGEFLDTTAPIIQMLKSYDQFTYVFFLLRAFFTYLILLFFLETGLNISFSPGRRTGFFIEILLFSLFLAFISASYGFDFLYFSFIHQINIQFCVFIVKYVEVRTNGPEN